MRGIGSWPQNRWTHTYYIISPRKRASRISYRCEIWGFHGDEDSYRGLSCCVAM